VSALLLAAVGGTGRKTSLYKVQVSTYVDVIDGLATEGGFKTSIRRRRRMPGLTYVALAADGLLAVELGGKGLEGRLNDTTTETEDKVKGGLL
jgi:hypothetical protein